MQITVGFASTQFDHHRVSGARSLKKFFRVTIQVERQEAHPFRHFPQPEAPPLVPVEKPDEVTQLNGHRTERGRELAVVRPIEAVDAVGRHYLTSWSPSHAMSLTFASA